jgi:hypothetical protein
MPERSEKKVVNKELSVPELQSVLEQFEDYCRKWLTGALSTVAFEQFSKDFYGTTFSLRELGGKEDDFDWDTFPQDVMAVCQATLERYSNVGRLVYAICQTIEHLREKVEQLDDPLRRIAYFCREFNSRAFDPRMISVQQSLSGTPSSIRNEL